MHTENLENFVGKKWSECELEIRLLSGNVYTLAHDSITTTEYVGNRVRV
jgi:hypothetical protein